MTDETLKLVLAKYGVAPDRVDDPQKGYRNSTHHVVTETKEYNLIIFKKEPDALRHIQASNQIGQFLHRQGMPARFPVDSRVLQVYGGTVPTYAGLYNYLPGSTIPWEAYTTKHLLALGKNQGDMHALLKGLAPAHDMPKMHETLAQLNKTMRGYFSKVGVRTALRTKLGLEFRRAHLGTQEKLLSALGGVHARQILHMDFVRGNVLFDENAQVSGIIDFEKASIGHPLFDIARTAAFLRVDCKFKDADTAFHIFFNRGYQKRGSVSVPRIFSDGADRTMDVLEALITLFLVHDLYKFLLHTPYESLHKNEHFVRTQAELLKRNVLTLSGDTPLVVK